MSNTLETLGFIEAKSHNRYDESHPSHPILKTFLAAQESLNDFLNQPHDQFVPGGSTEPNTSVDSEPSVTEGTDAVEKFQSIAEPTEAEREELAEAFLKNPSAAVSTLLNAARNESGWNPNQW